ncbi:MAG: glycosyltransferase family 4 protein [Bryobacterales bacterium]|nr:glycosyltransferase family 4 protein [Bryobacterales bacterium]MBV9398697.1 glycosyltransferase family 4 protein [Bryobacterales bacterium]
MRIAVDATCWHNRRGYGRHARALLRALIRLDSGNEYTLFLDSTQAAEPTPQECKVRVLQASVPTVQAASANGRRSLSDMWRMSRALSSSEFDVVLFPTIYSYVPIFSCARKLVMMHDVIAETFPQLTVPRRAARIFWNMKVALGRMQADALITVSDYSKQQILKRFGGDPNQVQVVGEAADPIFRRLEHPCPSPTLRKLGLDGSRPMVLYVGGFSPHKNLEALISAFARIVARPEFADSILAMVGDTSGDAFHTYYGTIAARVEALGLRDRVVFTGFMSDADLVALLNLGRVLVLPSLMEGFGLPAVEAAACGCPVIATKASPLEGLLGRGGVYIEPAEDDIARALADVLSSEQKRVEMSERATQAAQRLTWDNAARQMMSVINGVGAA